jgi:hypothetical protein
MWRRIVLIDDYRRFGGTCFSILRDEAEFCLQPPVLLFTCMAYSSVLQTEAVLTSETSLNFYPSI